MIQPGQPRKNDLRTGGGLPSKDRGEQVVNEAVLLAGSQHPTTDDLSTIDFSVAASSISNSSPHTPKLEEQKLSDSGSDQSSQQALTYGDALAVLAPYLKKPWKLLGNIGRAKLFGRMLAGNADYEYFRLYSNKENHFSPMRSRIFNEVNHIAGWLSHPEQKDLSITYFGAPFCIVRERDAAGHMQTSIIGRPVVFALAALRFYQAEYEESPAISKALGSVEELFRMSPNVNYEACAWWLIASMVMREFNETELVKALEESHGMILVANSLCPVEIDRELTFMEIQPAKERPLVEREELIPSFDFRVHAKRAFDPDRGCNYGTVVGFYEVKRTDRFTEASDVTSVIKSTISKKLEKTYSNPDGSEVRLLDHPSLKVLIIQVAWPEPGDPIIRERKKGYRIFQADGIVRYGFIRNGEDNEIGSSSIHDEIAANLNRIPGSKGLDAVYLTNLKGELIQAYYHSATPTETGVLLSKKQRDDSSEWASYGTEQISMESYFSF